MAENDDVSGVEIDRAETEIGYGDPYPAEQAGTVRIPAWDLLQKLMQNGDAAAYKGALMAVTVDTMTVLQRANDHSLETGIDMAVAIERVITDAYREHPEVIARLYVGLMHDGILAEADA